MEDIEELLKTVKLADLMTAAAEGIYRMREEQEFTDQEMIAFETLRDVVDAV